jgi:protein-disulfide isomerase
MVARSAILFCFVGAAAFFAAVAAPAQTATPQKTSAKPASIPQPEREQIEQVIHDYLLKNPSVLRESLLALQVQEENERNQRAAENLRTLKPVIYNDADSPTAGNKNAAVTVVVFFDYYCGYCRKALPELDQLVAKDSSLRIIYKEFPILSANSELAARAALAAASQGKYAGFHQALLESGDVSATAIKKISDGLGLDYAKLRSDMNGPKVSDAIKSNHTLADSLRIEGTPAYIIGAQVIRGAIPPAELAKLITNERGKTIK